MMYFFYELWEADMNFKGKIWISPSFIQADTCCQQKLLGLFCRVIVTSQKRGSSEQDKYPVFSAVSSILVCCFYLNGY